RTGPEANAAAGPLTAALRDEHPHVRAWAAVALGRLGLEANGALVPLTDALNDRSAAVRTAAAEALGRLDDAARAAVPSLIEAWRWRESYRRREGLGQTGIFVANSPRPEIPSPWNFLGELKEDDRKAAGNALERIDPVTARILRVR